MHKPFLVLLIPNCFVAGGELWRGWTCRWGLHDGLEVSLPAVIARLCRVQCVSLKDVGKIAGLRAQRMPSSLIICQRSLGRMSNA